MVTTKTLNIRYCRKCIIFAEGSSEPNVRDKTKYDFLSLGCNPIPEMALWF